MRPSTTSARLHRFRGLNFLGGDATAQLYSPPILPTIPGQPVSHCNERPSTVPKQFFRKLERLLSGIDATAGDEALLTSVLEQLVASDDANLFGIESGRLYRERARGFRPAREHG